MLRITQSISAAGAARYFKESLQVADYYSQGQQTSGYWGGLAAERLGLSGHVQSEQFIRLLHNQHPDTGEKLTARHDEDRRPGYDLTFSVPKSFSVYLAETQDPEMRAIVHAAIHETMQEMEGEMKTRVRKGGSDTDRLTGNMVWAAFAHDTSRPVDGVPDPHTHVHVYAMNATFDPLEDRWKAGQFGELKRDGPFWQASFDSRLAEKAQAAGFGIRRTVKGFELASVKPETVERFSKRTREIEETAVKETKLLQTKAKVLMKEKPGMVFSDALAEAKARLGAKTRESKRQGMGNEALLENWRAQMTPSEIQAIRAAKETRSIGLLEKNEAIALALEHTFARASVAPERTVLAAALVRGIGSLKLREVQEALASGDIIKKTQNGRVLLTTREVLGEEKAIIETVRRGEGMHVEARIPWIQKRDFLSLEQVAAVSHVVESSDRFTAIRGAAGTGKTTMMLEACEALAATSGKKVFTFAPSSEAVEVLRKEGRAGQSSALELADTVQMLLVSEQKQKEAAGQILWIDEAGLLSAKDFRKLAAFAERTHSRVILSGDVGQHRAVERGDLLRLLEKETPIRTAHLSQIRRQQVSEYKSAVESLSKGETALGFDKLDSLGAVREIEDRGDRNRTLAEAYVAKCEAGKTALIVAPTHAEGREITTEVRALLRKKGVLRGEEQTVIRLENLGWTSAQKKDAGNFKLGQVLEFHQNVKGFGKGQKWEVKTVEAGGRVLVSPVGLVGLSRVQELPLKEAERFSVYERQKLGVSVGDTVRITQNVMSADGKLRLKNNSLHKVEILEGDCMKLSPLNGLGKAALLEVSAGGHVTHGLVVTSHASQGKTVDHVLISQPTGTFGGTSEEQFYVSASRGRESVEIYTDSKELLRDAIQRSEGRQTAHELMWEGVPEKEGVKQGLKKEITEIQKQKEAKQKQHLTEIMTPVPPKQSRGMSL